MRSRRKFAVVALGAVAAMVLAACGGGAVSGGGSTGDGAADAGGVHNPSDQAGGTLRYRELR